MRGVRPDVAGVICGTVLAGAAAIWILVHEHVVKPESIGVLSALLLVLSGVAGLVASRRS